MMTHAEFAARAIRVPFLDLGRDYAGWDCWGMLCCYYRDVLGILLPDYLGAYDGAGIEHHEQLSAVSAAEIGSWRRVEDPRPGDGVLLNLTGRPIHVGIVNSRRDFLHTENRVNTLVERFASPLWSRRVEGFYRHDPAD